MNLPPPYDLRIADSQPDRANWDPTTKSIKDEGGLMTAVKKMGDTKKAMPFVQTLKKRLQTEDSNKVLERKLPFDEQGMLLDMVPGIKRTAFFREIAVIECEEGSKKGKDLTDGGKDVEITMQQAENAVPG
jgi:leucyl-tRNA synthetase